jgi:hypothetical protein
MITSDLEFRECRCRLRLAHRHAPACWLHVEALPRPLRRAAAWPSWLRHRRHRETWSQQERPERDRANSEHDAGLGEAILEGLERFVQTFLNPGTFTLAPLPGAGRPKGSRTRNRVDLAQMIMNAAERTGFKTTGEIDSRFQAGTNIIIQYSPFGLAHSTAKCNGESLGVEENLTRSSVAEYLSGARVEFILDPLAHRDCPAAIQPIDISAWCSPGCRRCRGSVRRRCD